jgi:hypothetical protein
VGQRESCHPNIERTIIMKRKVIAAVLLTLSLNAWAEYETKPLEEIQKKMIMQSSRILDEFNKHNLNTDQGIYQNIWLEEFNDIDYIDVLVNSAELFKSANSGGNSLSRLRIQSIIIKMNRFCALSLINWAEYMGNIKIPEVRGEVASQYAYAKIACDVMNQLEK